MHQHRRLFFTFDSFSNSSFFLKETAMVHNVLSINPLFATIGSCCFDFHSSCTSPPVGAKREGNFNVVLGGAAINAGRIGVVNKVRTCMFGVQRAGAWAELARELAGAEGLDLLLAERTDDRPAMSLINADGGGNTIVVQRMRPLRVNEIPAEWEETLRAVRAFLVGPLHPCADSFELLDRLSGWTPHAYRALVPHPLMLKCPEFATAASRFSYVQVNFEESKLLPGAGDDVLTNAHVLASLLAPGVDLAVTNGADRRSGRDQRRRLRDSLRGRELDVIRTAAGCSGGQRNRCRRFAGGGVDTCAGRIWSRCRRRIEVLAQGCRVHSK
jgi:sugar/nucleoside kinase (ribokinase family)